jgi:hypothetical protein
MTHAILERAFGRLGRLLETVTLVVEKPAMIAASQAIPLRYAIFQ